METLPPWDAIGYFNQPLVRVVSQDPGKSVQICDYNPQRVGLIVAAPPGASPSISPISQASAIAGPAIVLNTSQSTMYLTQHDWGPMVNQAWYVASGSSFVTVVELILNKWPEGGKDG